MAFLSSCGGEKSGQSSSNKSDSALTQRPPTATEVFHLRSECAELADKIMNENTIGIALTQSVLSHYDPKTNRCYAELTVQSADLSGNYFAEYLYDGQTKEMLAFIQTKNGKSTGIAFKKNIMGYEKVSEYIDQVMQDE